MQKELHEHSNILSINLNSLEWNFTIWEMLHTIYFQ